MDKIELNFSKKAIAQAVLPGIFFAVLLLVAVSQRVGIGQRYQEVTVISSKSPSSPSWHWCG